MEIELIAIQDITQEQEVLILQETVKGIRIAEEYLQTVVEAEVQIIQMGRTIRVQDHLQQTEVVIATDIQAQQQEQEAPLLVEVRAIQEEVLLLEAEALLATQEEVLLVAVVIPDLEEVVGLHQEAAEVEVVEAEVEVEDKKSGF